MEDKEIGIYAGSKVPHILKKSIERAVLSGNYLNESDFIRNAIKEKLHREGFLDNTISSYSKNNDIVR